jgi:DNA-binding response OmpR family regulator
METTAGRASRITIVDDARDFLDLMRLVLEPKGYALTCIAEHASLDALLESRPDLLMIDLRLGQPSRDLSGWELVVLASHHESLAGVPILVCSADLSELRGRTEQIGSSERLEMLAKPFDLDTLERTVERLLSPRHQRSA